MKKSILILLLSVSIITQTKACYNEYNVNLSGEVNEEFGGIPTFYRSFDLEFSELFVSTADLTKKADYDFKKLSDISIHLCRLGRTEEALELLQWLHYKHPNEYKIISNLGTTFELSGDLDSAIFYLNQAIEINPDSHHGSEWIHLRILNAKKMLLKDKNWLSNHSILQLNIDTKYELYSTAEDSAIDTIHHVAVQLKERLPYTPEDDILMAKLLKEYGNYMATHLSISDAAVIYRIAKHYDKNNIFDLDTMIDFIDKKMKEEKTGAAELEVHFPPKSEFYKYNRSDFPEIIKPNLTYYSYIFIIGILILAIGYYFLKRKN